MGKRIIPQRRGKGGLNWRAPKKGKVAPVKYPPLKAELVKGYVAEILHERGRSAPLARIELESGEVFYTVAAHGMWKGQVIEIGAAAKPSVGNILPLASIPEGTTICNIELEPGDGGRLVRAGGASAILFSQSGDKSIVRMPSGKTITLSNKCRAMIGSVAGGGRLEKPLLKAGKSYWKHKAKGKAYPRVRGVAMAAVYHPFGGGRHQHPGKPTSTPRNAPPGRKVGHIAPRKTGRGRVAKVVEVK